MRADVDAAVAEGNVVPLADGSVDIAVAAVEGEARGNYARDGVRRAVQNHRLSKDVERRAEFALPEASAENDDGRCAEMIVIGTKSAAEDGRYAERREKVGGDHVA